MAGLSKRLLLGTFILTFTLLVGIGLRNGAVLATHQSETPVPDAYLIFAPLIAKPAAPPTPTPTPTPTPINVSGVYYTVGSNMVTDCPGGVALPAPANVTVVHDNTYLAMTFPSGLSEGTINSGTGAFQVEQIFPSSNELRYGGKRDTIGTFKLTENPLVFNAITTFVINSETGIYCTFSFNHDGSRQ